MKKKVNQRVLLAKFNTAYNTLKAILNMKDDTDSEQRNISLIVTKIKTQARLAVDFIDDLDENNCIAKK